MFALPLGFALNAFGFGLGRLSLCDGALAVGLGLSLGRPLLFHNALMLGFGMNRRVRLLAMDVGALTSVFMAVLDCRAA